MKARALIGGLGSKLLLLVVTLAIGYLAGMGAHGLVQGPQDASDAPALEAASQESADQGTRQEDAATTTAADSEQGSPTDSQQGSPAEDLNPSPVSYTNWDETQSPNYYRELGTAEVGTTPDPGQVRYGKLDRLGRATCVVAMVTYDSMVAGRERSRGDTSAIAPSGWGHNEEVDMAMPDGSIYHGQFFNRSHLVAKSLGGEERIENLICGTRTQNVGANVGGHEGGMAFAEGLARDWLSQHRDGSVYYAATPAYEGDELVARSVIVDLRSSDGELDKRVEVYNAAAGFEIDYADGGFRATRDAQEVAREIAGSAGAGGGAGNSSPDNSGDTSTSAAQPDGSGSAQPTDTTNVVPTGTPEAENGERKVIVTKSGKAYHHDESCKGLNNARSMQWVTLSEAEQMGRRPCSICGG